MTRRGSRASLATIVYAHTKHWAVVIPTEACAGGIAPAILIGAMAGYDQRLPALTNRRASHLITQIPTDAEPHASS